MGGPTNPRTPLRHLVISGQMREGHNSRDVLGRALKAVQHKYNYCSFKRVYEEILKVKTLHTFIGIILTSTQ